MITGITDNDGVTQTTTMGILHTLVEFLRSKYNPIVVDDACVNLVEKTVHKTLPLR
jgi:nicotinamidase-related amidase